MDLTRCLAIKSSNCTRAAFGGIERTARLLVTSFSLTSLFTDMLSLLSSSVLLCKLLTFPFGTEGGEKEERRLP